LVCALAQEDAAAAMENMQDSEFFGRVLKVNIAKPDALRKKAGMNCFAALFYFCGPF